MPVFSEEYGSAFAERAEIRGRKRLHVSHNAEDLREPTEISGTGLWVETNLSSNHVGSVIAIVGIPGYPGDSFAAYLRS